MSQKQTYRIGTGAGFSSDRLDPAIDLVKRGQLNTIIFECVGERTLAFGHRDRAADPKLGYNALLETRLRALLPLCHAHGTRLITNMGVANPDAAAQLAVRIAHELGLNGLRIAAVTGDDVRTLIHDESPLHEPSCTVAETGRSILGANAYLGADAIIPALEDDAHVIITGRVADPSLFLAPIQHHFNWAADDWTQLGAGTLVGHLMECAAQVTGGYFADPGYKSVPNLAYVGFPIAEVCADGTAVITKLTDTGGMVNTQTVKEQLLYEVHNPNAYLTPDVTADFSRVNVAEVGADRVQVSNAGGAARPDQLKVTVAFDGGYLAEAEVSYAGPGAVDRAALASTIVKDRINKVHGIQTSCRTDLIGLNALHQLETESTPNVQDFRLRTALRTNKHDAAQALLWEVESLLCCGPAGGAGYRGRIEPSVLTYSTFVKRDQVTPKIEILSA
ncbi:MAG: acyclic terpene utilization AtuA family protein [Pseudomonadota bacterium]|nr:acyclic terpene utilization AtuA family protein [Pseudomonadota bacterium]